MEEWIKQNYDVIFGIIGALYVAARGIAFLTPTPKDDIYITKDYEVVYYVACYSLTSEYSASEDAFNTLINSFKIK